MKHILFSLVCIGSTLGASAQMDMSIGNISAGYDSYNASTGVVSGVYFDVLNNQNAAVSDFEVAVYAIEASADPAVDANYHKLYSKMVEKQNGNTVVTYSDLKLNLNDGNMPAGNYRLVVNVDPDNKISESNESNNGLFLTPKGSDLSFKPSAGGEIKQHTEAATEKKEGEEKSEEPESKDE